MKKNFILIIPGGIGFAGGGPCLINDLCIFETAYPWNVQVGCRTLSKKISGRVACIVGYDDYYYHWMHDVLGKLIMLQKSGIKYDKLYIACDRSYQTETLKILGVNFDMIVKQGSRDECIQADELICPSLPARVVVNDFKLCKKFELSAFYYRDWVISYLRDLLLPLSCQITTHFSERVFISRNDAWQRKIINEDEVFALFEQEGFERYCLSNMSVVEQVALFAQAKYIVGAHSSGLTNLIFCQPGTKVVEIFQARLDLSFFYIAQQMNLRYDYIKTIDFVSGNDHIDTIVPLGIIESFIQSYKFA